MTIFDPLSQPFRGLRTAIDPTAVGPGFFTSAQNIRVDTELIALRAGTTLLANAGITGTYSVIGATLIQEGVNTFVYVACQFSSTDVRIYFGVHNGTSWHTSLTEITASAGQFGATRMNAPDNGYVRFQTVYDRSYGLSVIAQNGKDAPRLLNGSLTPDGRARRIEAIPAPNQGNLSPQFGVSANLNITATTTAATPTGQMAATSTGTPQYWRFTTGASAIAVNDTATLTIASDTDFSQGDQVFVIADTTTDAFFTNCRWSLIRATGGDLTIHDPDAGLDSLVSVETNVPGLRVYGFPLGHLVGQTLTNVRGLRLTALNPRIPVSQTLNIYTLAVGGRVPGNAEYEVSHFNEFTQTESPSVVLPNFGGPQNGVTAIWGSSTAPLPEGFQFPISESLRYRVLVPTVAPGSADRDKGVGVVRVYRRDPGEDQAYYVGEESAASYSAPTWSYTANYTSGYYLWPDTVSEANKDGARPAPGAFVLPVPIGQAMCFASRFYVGTFRSSVNDNKGVVAVSDVDFPFRFRSLTTRPDVEGFTAALEGGEDIRGIAPASGTLLGSASVYVLTSENIYSVAPPFVRKVASIGILGGESLSENKGLLYWVDRDRAVRRMGGNIQDVSSRRVDLAPYSGILSACYWQDRYYLCVTEGTTRKVLVWSDDLGDWESIDLPGVAPALFLPWRRGDSSSLILVASDGRLFQYESGTTDNGAQIAFQLTTGQFHSRDWERIRLGSSSIVALDKTAESATFTYTTALGETSPAETINLDVATTYGWSKAKGVNGGDVMIAGPAVNASMSVTCAAPFRLAAWKVTDGSRAGVGQRA